MWFALSGLAGLGAIVAIKAATTSLQMPVVAPPAQHATVEEGLAPDRAAKSDRLPIPVLHEPAVAAALPQMGAVLPAATPAGAMDELLDRPETPAKPPSVAADEPPRRPAETRPHRHRWQDANARLVETPHQRRHAKAQRPRTEAADEPSKATANAVPCRQDAVGGLLRALDLSPRCG